MLSRNAQASEFCVSCVSQDSLFPGNPHVWMGSDSSCTGGALPVTVAAGALMSLTCSRRDEPFSLVPVTAQKSESTPGPPLKDMHLLNPSHGTPHPPPHVGSSWCLGVQGFSEYTIRTTVLLQSWQVSSRRPSGSGTGELQVTNSVLFCRELSRPFIHSCLQPTGAALLMLSVLPSCRHWARGS